MGLLDCKYDKHRRRLDFLETEFLTNTPGWRITRIAVDLLNVMTTELACDEPWKVREDILRKFANAIDAEIKRARSEAS